MARGRCGQKTLFDIRIVPGVRWRSARKQNLAQIIIRPLGYRLSKGAGMLYREPAYLICAETGLDILNILQAYLWRWEIEVDFREEKTILGCGQARNTNSAESLPAFVASMYGLLHQASPRATARLNKLMPPMPEWYPKQKGKRVATGDLLNNLRAQLWAKTTRMNFSGFINNLVVEPCQKNIKPSLSSS